MIYQEKKPNRDGYYDYAFKEFLATYNTFNCQFVDILENIEKFQDEISFYKDEGIPEIIKYFVELVHGEEFWKAVHRAVKSYVTPLATNATIVSFAKTLRKSFVDSLEGKAKKECIEVSKILDSKSK